MSGIAWIGIPAAGCNIVLITVIFGPLCRTHLSAKEHRNPDEERTADDQRRRERRQIREHAGHLL
jgi:hypothetical protein